MTDSIEHNCRKHNNRLSIFSILLTPINSLLHVVFYSLPKRRTIVYDVRGKAVLNANRRQSEIRRVNWLFFFLHYSAMNFIAKRMSHYINGFQLKIEFRKIFGESTIQISISEKKYFGSNTINIQSQRLNNSQKHWHSCWFFNYSHSQSMFSPNLNAH